MFLYKELYRKRAIKFDKEKPQFSHSLVSYDETINKIPKASIVTDPYSVLLGNMKKVTKNDKFYLDKLWSIYQSAGSEKEREGITASIFAIGWSEKLNTDHHYFVQQIDSFPDFVLLGFSKENIKGGKVKFDQKDYFEIVSISNSIIETSRPEEKIYEAVRQKVQKNYKFEHPLRLLIDVQMKLTQFERIKACHKFRNIRWLDQFQDIFFMAYEKKEDDILIWIEVLNRNGDKVEFKGWNFPLIKTTYKIAKILKTLQQKHSS